MYLQNPLLLEREKNIEVVPDVYRAFMMALIDVASQGKDCNTPGTTLRQIQRGFYPDDRVRHDLGKDGNRRGAPPGDRTEAATGRDVADPGDAIGHDEAEADSVSHTFVEAVSLD